VERPAAEVAPRRPSVLSPDPQERIKIFLNLHIPGTC
jgi:hypothetical protein